MQNAHGSKTTHSQWRWIPGFEERYLISDRGLVARILRPRLKHGRFGAHARVTLPTSKDSHIYTDRYIHELVLTTFVGPRPPGHEACHTNDDGLDNRLRNLRWDTKSANRQEAWQNALRRGYGKRAIIINQARDKATTAAQIIARGIAITTAAALAKISTQKARRIATTIARCRCGHFYGAHTPHCICGCPRQRPIIQGNIRRARGQRIASSQLTEQQVHRVRDRLHAGASQRTVAREFSVSRGAIAAIQNRQTWTWLSSSNSNDSI